MMGGIEGKYSLLNFRYLHACSTILLKNQQIGALVAGGYADEYLNSTEIFDPVKKR